MRKRQFSQWHLHELLSSEYLPSGQRSFSGSDSHPTHNDGGGSHLRGLVTGTHPNMKNRFLQLQFEEKRSQTPLALPQNDGEVLAFGVTDGIDTGAQARPGMPQVTETQGRSSVHDCFF